MIRIDDKLDAKLQASPDWIFAEVDSEVVLMHAESGEYMAIVGAGVTIWQFLQDNASVSDICARLIEEYDIDPDQCRSSTVAFVQQLLSENMVSIV